MGYHTTTVVSAAVDDSKWRVKCSCGWKSKVTVTRLEATARGTVHQLNPNDEDM